MGNLVVNTTKAMYNTAIVRKDLRSADCLSMSYESQAMYTVYSKKLVKRPLLAKPEILELTKNP